MSRSIRLVLIFAIFATVPIQGRAVHGNGSLSSATLEAIQDVIAGQIEAFGANDGERAFSFASPGIRGIFATPDNFMNMVRTGFAPLLRPRRFDFRDALADGAMIEQHVLIVGEDGRVVLAVYTMERQDDGTWRIAGCRLEKVPQSDV